MKLTGGVAADWQGVSTEQQLQCCSSREAREKERVLRGRILKTSSSVPSFFLLTRQMMERLSGKEFELWAMIAWALWNARNCIHFQNTQAHPTEILKQATDLLVDYQKLVRNLVQGQKTR
nr:hypothetical protein CFP56_65685 [Quercus suber]